MTPPSLIVGHARLPLSQLVPSPENPRKPLKQSDPQGFADLKASMERGQFAPLLVEKSTNEIIGGHQRYDAARDLGWEDVDCTLLRDLTPEERIRIRAADNAHFHAQWNLPELREQLITLPTEELPLLGLDGWVLKDLALDPPPIDPEPEPEKKEEWVTLKFKMSTDQAALIKEALASVKQEADDETKITDSMALYKLAFDWVQQSGVLRE